MCCFQEFSRMSVARLLLHFYTMNQVLFEDVPCSHLKKKKLLGEKNHLISSSLFLTRAICRVQYETW